MSEAIADPVDPTPKSSDADETRFLLNSRVDIAHVLRALVRTRALAIVHSSHGRETLLTPFLALDAAAGEIIFDCSANESLNRNVLQARKLLFVSSQDKVKIRFTTAPARAVTSAGRAAFAVPIPQELLRLQRRDTHRLLTPVANPVKCIFALPAEGSIRYLETRLHDLSHGGVAVVIQPGELNVEVGARYPNCRIVLPDTGNVVVTLEVRYVTETTLLNGKSVLRAGCQFVRPSMSTLTLVQRYMMKLERARKARED